LEESLQFLTNFKALINDQQEALDNMTRQRSTWTRPGNGGAPRQAATSRRADIFTMNQEHPQPSPVEYENGNPDEWAETPTTNKNVEGDYDGDHVRRNEVGFGEIRKDTFDHKDSDQWGESGKYDNARQAAVLRKASNVTHLARILLRSTNAKEITDQATELMALPATVVASTLKRLQKLSTDNLPKDVKYRRAYACCKLAARILDSENEDRVQSVATVLMTLDDPTLKTLLKHVAAADAEDDDQQSQQAQDCKDDQQSQQAQGQQAQDQEQTQDQQAQDQDQTQDQQGLTSQELQALDQMLSAEMQGCMNPTGCECGPAPELTELFAPAPAPAPAAPPVVVAPVASEITFDDDGEDDGEMPHIGSTDELANLFADHPEVQAQREIQASEQEARVASGGYGPNPTSRTASTAKKIGQVQVRQSNKDDELANLWDRPPAL
jgi:hypothetical protein